MRLKLICILSAIVAVFMFVCSSCVAKVDAQSYSDKFDVKPVYNDRVFVIYQVTTPKGSVYVARYGQGLCTLN